jgi:hypothetical protein
MYIEGGIINLFLNAFSNFKRQINKTSKKKFPSMCLYKHLVKYWTSCQIDSLRTKWSIYIYIGELQNPDNKLNVYSTFRTKNLLLKTISN